MTVIILFLKQVFYSYSLIYLQILCMCTKSLQLCLTLCDPVDSSLWGSSVRGISRQEYWIGMPTNIISKYKNHASFPQIFQNNFQSKYKQSSMDKEVVGCVCVCVCVYKMECYSAIKRNEFESVLLRWNEKIMSYINAYMWNLEKWY